VDLQSAFEDAAAHLGVGPVVAEFYPYSELKHTWIRTRGVVRFKVSDYLMDAPPDVMASLAEYLLSKALGKLCGDEAKGPYIAFAGSSQCWESARGRYLQRARSLCFDVKGHSRDLDTVFDYVNSFYFSGKAPEPVLAWVSESPRRRLGFYFEPLKILAANRALDSDSVPRYVLEFVMYHELLHHLRAGDGRAIRRVHHTNDFKAQERMFNHFEEAESWLRRIASRR